jgi:hypothetical protein
MSGTAYQTTTLSAGVNASVTTLPVASTAGFIATGGRVTIGTEKILYEYTDATNFYGCIRGAEGTTASTHNTSDTVKENNLIIFYNRLPLPITASDTPSPTTLAKNIEIVEEHMEGITDIIAYKLLVKVDPERAVVYKVDAEALYEQYSNDIRAGYYRGRKGVNVRDPYSNETGIPMFNNNIY